MSNRNKGKANYSSAWLCVLLFIILTYCSTALNTKPVRFHHGLTTISVDTPPVKKPLLSDTTKRVTNNPKKVARDSSFRIISDSSTIVSDTIINGTDTIIRKSKVDTFAFKISKDTLAGPVVYHADDSMILDVPTKKLYLYGKLSTIKYTDNELAAPQIEYDQRTNLVKAALKKDSLGKVISFVSFNQGTFKSVMDSIEFNMKTGRGLTKGTYTQQDEIFIYGDKIKRVNSEVFYAANSRFTTCNLDTPHFAFVSKKIKFISGKMAFTGPVHPEFEGVPLPISLPFGIFPLSQGRHSGFLRPTFAVNDQSGISLEGLGYYKILSPTWDLITRGTIFSYGGWAANINPRYYKRYRYQGNLSFDIQKVKYLDQPSSQTMHLTWTHSMDNKARPGVTFSANVNAGSSKYNEQVPNRPITNFNNQLQSSITYAKVWKDRPYNISISANHNQNTVTRLINLNLPDVVFNVNTLYPFRKKEAIGDLKWYENIGVGLNTNARSLSYFYDTLANISDQIKNNFQYGARHSIPITLSLPPVGVFQIAPSVSYEEKWYQERIKQTWNATTQRLDTNINKGFYRSSSMSFGLGASTRIFGMYGFNKSSNIVAIRHEIRPSLSLVYTPDLTKGSYNPLQQVDTAGNFRKISYYEGSIYGAYSSQTFAGLSFSIDNNLTMKLRNKKDTSAGATRKVSLLDGLSLGGSYNFLADSFKLSLLTVSARTNLFDKVNITAGATFDPYEVNRLTGFRQNKFVWSRNPVSLGTLTNASLSLQSSFKGGDKSKKTPAQDLATLQNDALRSGVALDEYQQEAAYIQNNPGQFVDFTIPWSVDFSYSLRYGRSFLPNNIVTTAFGQDMNFNASVNLTVKWKLGVNGSYNISDGQLGLISMYLTRDLHCWQMAITISRSERYRFFTLNISPKSPILRDLKVNRTRSFVDL